jgi:hypothetical protein
MHRLRTSIPVVNPLSANVADSVFTHRATVAQERATWTAGTVVFDQDIEVVVAVTVAAMVVTVSALVSGFPRGFDEQVDFHWRIS